MGCSSLKRLNSLITRLIEVALSALSAQGDYGSTPLASAAMPPRPWWTPGSVKTSTLYHRRRSLAIRPLNYLRCRVIAALYARSWVGRRRSTSRQSPRAAPGDLISQFAVCRQSAKIGQGPTPSLCAALGYPRWGLPVVVEGQRTCMVQLIWRNTRWRHMVRNSVEQQWVRSMALCYMHNAGWTCSSVRCSIRAPRSLSPCKRTRSDLSTSH